jgi:signal transduction histidine kinase/HAMP domain-containing protein
VFFGLRRSFAAKLVALEIGTILAVSVAVAAALVATRLLQTRDLEQNVARSAAGGLRADLDTAGANAYKLTGSLANFPALQAEFGNPDASRMDALVTAEVQSLPNRGETLVAFDALGHPLLARTSTGNGGADHLDAATFAGMPSVAQAGHGRGSTVGLVEPVAGKLRLDATSAVQRDGAVVGYITDSQDLQDFLARVVRPHSGIQYSVFYNERRVDTTLPNGVEPGLPGVLGNADDSGGRFGVYELGGHTYAGYYSRVDQGENVLVAADVDDAVFAAQRVNDILVVVLATTLLATILSLVGVFFARRTALQPLAALTEGAERVKAGDYAARVSVDTEDDFGRLAATFNDMAAQIRSDSQEKDRQRARLDAAISSLSSVSRALTATTSGEGQLRQAVLESVLELTGADAVAMYEGTEKLKVTAGRGLEAGEARTLLGLLDHGRVVAGDESVLVRLEEGPGAYQGWSALAVPMVFQGKQAGLIAAYSRGNLDGIDIPSLSVLANQAVVALQNSVLFQRERETVARLQQLDGMKSDFLATIQHELRTPLTAIMGMTDLLEMAWGSWDDAQKLDALGDVQVSAKSLYEIVETILDYSMLESDRVALHLGDYALRQITDEAVEELRPLIRRSDVKIEVKVPARIKVKGDGQRLNQVMKALIDNAVKFSPEKARVQVRASQQNGRVTLQVVDRGIGISTEHQAQIFDRFFQVDNTATRRYGGTGMGLALVKKLVEMQGGKVTVESTPGKGSTFTVVLPTGA